MIENKVKGRFEITVLREGEKYFHSEFSNMLLNGAFNGGSSSYYAAPSLINRGYCGVGTGTTPPVGTQTGVQGTLLGIAPYRSQRAVTTVEDVDSTTVRMSFTLTYMFNLGSIVGNAAEIVISNSSNVNPAYVRSLIRDANGNPTVLSLTTTDQLIVKHTLIVTAKHSQLSPAFSKTIRGVTHNFYVSSDRNLALTAVTSENKGFPAFFQNYVWYANYYTGSNINTGAVGTLLGQEGLDLDNGNSVYPDGSYGAIPNVLSEAERPAIRVSDRSSAKLYGFPIRLARGNFSNISCIEFESNMDTLASPSSERVKLRIFVDPPLTKDSSQYLGFKIRYLVSADE